MRWPLPFAMSHTKLSAAGWHKLAGFSLVWFLASAAWAADGPRLFFSKSFPGSVPAYFQVNLDQAGNAEYREAPDEEPPLTFKLSEADARAVFELADKLDHFRRPLESKAKVAFTGAKIFRYENGGEKGEAKFNFSEDTGARDLLDWFERMGESAARRIELERTAKYDKLGVMRALLLLAQAMENKRILGPEQFLPVLDRIAKNQTYMHTAQERAAQLAETIRAGK